MVSLKVNPDAAVSEIVPSSRVLLRMLFNNSRSPPHPPSTLSLSFLPPSLPIPFSSSSSDYGFMPADGFNGPCVRDEAVPLVDPCADGQVKTVMKSRGYRKVAGDVCIKGVSGLDFEPYNFTCCSDNSSNSSPSPAANIITNDNKPLVAGLGVALAIFILVSVVLGLVAAIYVW